MRSDRELGQSVDEESESGLRLVRPWRLLVAHDATSSTCDQLIRALDGALGSVDLTESSSTDDARLASKTARYDVALVCLDLPPAPSAGARLAEELLHAQVPVVLVTRSLRWLPASAVALRDVPWVAPDADGRDIARAVREAVTQSVERRRVEHESSRLAGDAGAGSPKPSRAKARFSFRGP